MAGPYHGNQYTLWWHTESTRGTLYSATSGDKWKQITQHSKGDIGVTASPVGVKQSGAKDNATQKKGSPQSVKINVSLSPNTDAFTFVKQMLTTTPDSTFSFVMKENTAGETFQLVNGCVIESWTENVQLYPQGTAVNWDIGIRGRVVTTTESGAFYDTISSTFYNWSDVTHKLGAAGGSPSTITNALSHRFTLSNKIDIIPDDTGASNDIRVGTRDIEGQLVRSVLDSGSSEFGEVTGGTLKKIQILLGTDSITFDDCLWSEALINADRGSMATKPLNFTVGDMTLA